MIRQIANIKTKTMPAILHRDALPTREIQAGAKENAAGEARPTEAYLWSPIHAGPYLVPITRWIE